MNDEKKNETPLSEEDPMVQEAVKEMYSSMMLQLLESERFVNWFRCNYDVKKEIDEEAKTIEYKLVELPHELAQERIMEMFQEKAAENEEGIQMPSPEDTRKFGGML